MPEMAEFLSIPRPVKARRLFVDSWEQINGKQKFVPAGMWIVQAVGGTGDQLMMPDDIFRLQFRPTDTRSEAAWNETTNSVYPHWPDGHPMVLS